MANFETIQFPQLIPRFRPIKSVVSQLLESDKKPEDFPNQWNQSDDSISSHKLRS